MKGWMNEWMNESQIIKQTNKGGRGYIKGKGMWISFTLNWTGEGGGSIPVPSVLIVSLHPWKIYSGMKDELSPAWRRRPSVCPLSVSPQQLETNTHWFKLIIQLHEENYYSNFLCCMRRNQGERNIMEKDMTRSFSPFAFTWFADRCFIWIKILSSNFFFKNEREDL